MEVSQGNVLGSYLKQAKMSFLFPFFCKIREQEGETGPAGWRGVATSGRGEEVGKGCKRVNMVQILCAHECKWENETC
jgi:hypothetical protein